MKSFKYKFPSDCAAQQCLLEFHFPQKLSGFSADENNFNVA